jgi:3-oxoadipate enol-lactonase
LNKRVIVTGDGVPIAYSDLGNSEGPPVVLCHGICASGRQFEADAKYFAAAGYRVIVPDLRAHGVSGTPPIGTGDFSIDRLAADMQAVLDDAAVERVHWVGNSLGGIVGLGMIRAGFDRFCSFATFGTAYRLSLPMVAPGLLPLLYRTMGPGPLGRITAALTTSDPQARALIAEMVSTFDPRPGERIARAVHAYDLVEAAQQFKGPVLLLRGGKDRAVNLGLASTFAAMARHPDFRQVDLPRGGHCANLDAPVEFRAALDVFWRRAGAQPIPFAPSQSC